LLFDRGSVDIRNKKGQIMGFFLEYRFVKAFLAYREVLKSVESKIFKSRSQIAFEIMLTILNYSGSCLFVDIRNSIKATEASIRTHIRMLERQGLVVELEDAQDRRVRKVVLTEKGLKVSEDYIAAVIKNDTFLRLCCSSRTAADSSASEA
jgi:DNA-binding MarR family transcriptional regulator